MTKRKKASMSPDEDFAAGFNEATTPSSSPAEAKERHDAESTGEPGNEREPGMERANGSGENTSSETKALPDMATLHAEVRQTQAMLAELLARAGSRPGGTESPMTAGQRFNGSPEFAAPTPPSEIDTLYRENPRIQQAIRWEAERLMSEQFGDGGPRQLRQHLGRLQDEFTQERFERALLNGYPDENGDWVDGHPDAYRVLRTPDFRTWYQNEMALNPALRKMNDPREALRLLHRFKQGLAEHASRSHDSAASAEARRRMELASGSLEDAPSPNRSSGAPTQDFDAAFHEAVAALRS